MSDKRKGKWAEGASAYRPASASARAKERPTRPWHVEGETAPSDERASVAFARTLPIGAIEADPDQPRRTFDAAALDELAASVREQGVLQPLLVRRVAGGSPRYVVVAGERRLRAARLAGLAEVPCMVLAGDSLRDARLAQLAENLQREDLEPMEEAVAVVRLGETEGLSNEELAKRLGKSPAYISRIFAVSRIDSAEYGEISTSKPSASLLYEYAQLEGDAVRRQARRKIAEGATVRDLAAMRAAGKRGAKRRGRPAKSTATIETVERAVATLERAAAAELASAGASQRNALCDLVARFARWAGEALGEGETGDAARALAESATRASSEQASTPGGRARRAGRRATSSRPR